MAHVNGHYAGGSGVGTGFQPGVGGNDFNNAYALAQNAAANGSTVVIMTPGNGLGGAGGFGAAGIGGPATVGQAHMLGMQGGFGAAGATSECCGPAPATAAATSECCGPSSGAGGHSHGAGGHGGGAHMLGGSGAGGGAHGAGGHGGGGHSHGAGGHGGGAHGAGGHGGGGHGGANHGTHVGENEFGAMGMPLGANQAFDAAAAMDNGYQLSMGGLDFLAQKYLGMSGQEAMGLIQSGALGSGEGAEEVGLQGQITGLEAGIAMAMDPRLASGDEALVDEASAEWYAAANDPAARAQLAAKLGVDQDDLAAIMGSLGNNHSAAHNLDDQGEGNNPFTWRHFGNMRLDGVNAFHAGQDNRQDQNGVHNGLAALAGYLGIAA
ncbi:hypothetical protein [Futiania mangrovi]|uniref:Uncharacterized protein n=1 Tax=Futiania mangrovi TaxID=2959716 RepID=A0A9J6PI25_9PROT|nr:hypothetical protein [Futiania mangrovii]MCP1337464.1 hypothetical protein [Futiania mangrovii]